MKLSFFLINIFLLTICKQSLAQEDVIMQYQPSIDCFVKKYGTEGLEAVSDKEFSNINLLIRKMKKNPQFSGFKKNGNIYIAPTRCFKGKNQDFEEIDPGQSEENENPNNNKYEHERRKKEDEFIQRTITGSASSHRQYKYFIQLSAGANFNSNKGNIYPWESEFQVGSTDSQTSATIQSVSPINSSYKTKLIIQADYGFHSGDIYYIFRFQNYKAEMSENAEVGESDGNVYTYNVKSTDTLSNLFGGVKYKLIDRSTIQPFLSLLIGISTIDETLINQQDSSKNIELSNSTLAGAFEVGIDTILSPSLLFSSALGYNYLPHKSMRIKDSNSSSGVSDTGFTPKLKYSQIYGTIGVAYTW